MDPKHAALFASLFIGTVGFAIFIYGKKQNRIPQVVAGLAMIAFPFFIGSLWWMVGIAVGLLAVMTIAVRLGL